MNNRDKFDQLLKQALSPMVEPDEELNCAVIDNLISVSMARPVHKRNFSFALAAVICILTLTVTAFAAWRILNPAQVAEQLGDNALAGAFKSSGALEINKTIESGGYSFTLLGIVSGEGLSDYKSSACDINPDRTYAVVSIAKLDGNPMPDTSDIEYGEVPFFISPLIKGQKPWQLNIASMNGGYSEDVIDGVMYRLIECDGVEIFAYRGLYLCISTSAFYDINAFSYNEKTGEIAPKSDYKGANVLFDLPLDIKKADHEKAEKYLQEFYSEPSEAAVPDEEATGNLKAELLEGEVIPDSIKVVTSDENGMLNYEYEGSKVSVALDSLFRKGEVGTSDMITVSETDNEKIAIIFSRDTEGVITGRAIRFK